MRNWNRAEEETNPKQRGFPSVKDMDHGRRQRTNDDAMTSEL